MHFVDGDRLLEPIGLGALGCPCRVIPLVGIQVGDNGAGARPEFRSKGVRISLERHHVSVGADDFVFVDGAFVELRDKKLPYARGPSSAHRVNPAVPLIEIAYDANAASAWRPDSEIDTTHAFNGVDVRAELVVGVVVAAFAHEVEVELAQKKRKSVGIVLFVCGAGGESVLKAIAGRGRAILLSFRKACFKKAFWTELCCFDQCL